MFLGVLFGLKVVNNHCDPSGVTYIWHIRVSNRFASWVELVLIYLVAPKWDTLRTKTFESSHCPWITLMCNVCFSLLCLSTSFIGHLAGILVGLMYTVGPLETAMKMCAGLYMFILQRCKCDWCFFFNNFQVCSVEVSLLYIKLLLTPLVYWIDNVHFMTNRNWTLDQNIFL